MESLAASITCVNTWCIHMTTSPRMDYISTWAWAITIPVISLSMTSSANDWSCVFSTTQNQRWSLSTAFDWYPVLVTIQLQPPYQDGTSPFGLLGISNTGTGTWDRTRDDRVKVCCVTSTPFPNKTWWLWKVSILPPGLMKPVRIRLRHTTWCWGIVWNSNPCWRNHNP